jgi:hypothetical protein
VFVRCAVAQEKEEQTGAQEGEPDDHADLGLVVDHAVEVWNAAFGCFSYCYYD